MKCNLCQKEGDLSFCSKCKKVTYCSRECQVEDWKNHKLTCGKQQVNLHNQQINKFLLVQDDQNVLIKILRKHFINIYRYIYMIDQKEADQFKQRNTYYYNKKHENQTKQCKHKHDHSASPHTENKSSNGSCCTTFFAKIYIPDKELTHIERAAKETLAKHKLPYVLPELLEFISKKFYKLKEDGLKDKLEWNKQTQTYLIGECLKGGCQQFFINKIKEFSLKDQRVDSKQPLLLATATTWKANNPKIPLEFLSKESLSEFMTKGYTYIKKYVNAEKYVKNLYKELNYLEMDGRFDEPSMNDSKTRSDRLLWLTLGEISEKDFPNVKKIAFQLSALPYEFNHKTQICVQISELFQISYFKANGSFQKPHYESSFDGDQDNGRKINCLYFNNLDDDIDCTNYGKVKLYTSVSQNQNEPGDYVEFSMEPDSVLIFKSRLFPYEILPNNSNNSKRFVVRYWITGPIEQNKKF
ncbi:hypothetical protein ABPG72_015829 [Tetrahymena utriculariae]